VDDIRVSPGDASKMGPTPCGVDGVNFALYSSRAKTVRDSSPYTRSIHWSPYDRVRVVNADP